MRDYQRRRCNKYQLPTAVYHQTLWIIRDYHRMQEELDAILLESRGPAPGGTVSGGAPVSEVQVKAERREPMLQKVMAIEKALNKVPPEYRRGIWDNICERKAFPEDADRSTYGRWKSRFVYEVAVALKLIERSR